MDVVYVIPPVALGVGRDMRVDVRGEEAAAVHASEDVVAQVVREAVADFGVGEVGRESCVFVRVLGPFMTFLQWAGSMVVGREFDMGKESLTGRH